MKETMCLKYMYRDQVCTEIFVDFTRDKIRIKNHTDKIYRKAFGAKEKPTWEDFNIFLRDRVFPPTRGNVKELLQELGLQSYDPLQIIEKTGGRVAVDNMHVEISYMPQI